MKFGSRKSFFLAGFSLLPACPAMAQDQGGAEAADIIVTARRVQERLQDVPISMTVFNQDQIAQRNIVNAQDLAQYTPSLSSNSTFGSDNSTFAIRGFVQDVGTSPSVGVYFADVVAPRGGSGSISSGDGAGPGSFFDLQNVQVLKGPQGTLFGRNTTGGAVLLVPQKPTGQFEGYAEGSIGNYDMRRVQAVLNIPVTDTLRLRFGADRLKRDGWLQNTSGIGPKDFLDTNYLALRASIVADLTPTLENYTVISYNRSNTNGPIQPVIACRPGYSLGDFACAQLADAKAKGEGFYTVRNDVAAPRSKLETWQIVNTSTWIATDTLTVKNIASYAQLHQTLVAPLFGTQFTSPAVPALGVPSLPISFASVNPAPNGRGTSYQ